MKQQYRNSEQGSAKEVRSHIRDHHTGRNSRTPRIGGQLDLRLGIALVFSVALALCLVLVGPLSSGSTQSIPTVSEAAMPIRNPKSTTQNPITIRASSGPHGSISPSGKVTVNYGADQTFSVIPDALCYIADVVVDGSSVGAVASYTFANATSNHRISARFAYGASHTITASAGAHGSISPSGTVTVGYGADQTFAVVPDAGYHIQSVLVDGSSIGAVNSYTFSNTIGNHAIAASFAPNGSPSTTYCTIAASADYNGAISPSGTVSVGYGEDETFTIVPDAGYHIQSVLVDGSSVGAVSTYPFTNVTGNHTIAASFAPDSSQPATYYTITASAGAHGSMSPSGTVTVASGANQAFTIVPSAGYHIQSVLVDGSSVGAVSTYTFSKVAGNHTIAASFAIDTSTMPTLVVAAKGSSHPENADYVCDGLNDEVQISAAVASLTANGGVVELLDGTFTIGANSQVVLKSNVTIKGQGSASTIISKPSQSGNNGVFGADSYYAPYSNIALADMKIDLGTTSSTSSPVWADEVDGLSLSNVYILSSSRNGWMYVRSIKHFRMISCTLDGVRLMLAGGGVDNDASTIESEDGLVQYCTIVNAPSDEFAIGNGCNNFRILDNTFTNCGHMAIDTCNSMDVLVSGNIIDGACLSHGWDGAIYTEGGRRVTITNNRINNVPYSAGIMASYMIWGYGHGGDILIDNNVITNANFGIACMGIPDVTISNNQISGTSWHGILVESKDVYGVTYYPDDCKVIGNRVSDFGNTEGYSSGVQLNDCQRCEVRSNVIDGSDNTNAVYGIRESGRTDYSVITGNTLSNVKNPISLVGSHSTSTGNIVQ
jgi:predicted ester cyclase